MSATLLVLGSSGFVGSHLADAADATDLAVARATREGGGGCLRVDLLDPESIHAALREVRPALVANMAGFASVAASWDDPAVAGAVNATGTENLLDAVAEVVPTAHIVCASSAEVYGEASPARLPFTEEMPVAPITPYGESKAAMEEHCSRHARERGTRIAVVRAFNQLGPGQPPDYVVSGFARQIAAAESEGADRAAVAVGNLEAARDFTDVRDSARAYLGISRAGLTGTFNLCSGRATPLREVIAGLAAASSLVVEPEPSLALRRPRDAPVVYGSPRRLHEATGWEPELTLERSLADALQWWRARPAR